MSGDVWLSFSRDEIHELLKPPTGRLLLLSRSRDRARRSAFDKLRTALKQQPAAHRLLAGRFEDGRGRIQDLIDGPLDAVTRITTTVGAVRGNHVHRRTVQWTYILSGRLLMATGEAEGEMGPGEIAVHRPGEPHAWRALEDTDCLVFTHGPRSGENYEADTYRLNVPLLG